MPAHGHSASTNNTGAHTHTTTIGYDEASGTGYGKYLPKDTGTKPNRTITSDSAGNHTHTVTVANTGSGNVHNNLLPYLTCYIWYRTA